MARADGWGQAREDHLAMAAKRRDKSPWGARQSLCNPDLPASTLSRAFLTTPDTGLHLLPRPPTATCSHLFALCWGRIRWTVKGPRHMFSAGWVRRMAWGSGSWRYGVSGDVSLRGYGTTAFLNQALGPSTGIVWCKTFVDVQRTHKAFPLDNDVISHSS